MADCWRHIAISQVIRFPRPSHKGSFRNTRRAEIQPTLGSPLPAICPTCRLYDQVDCWTSRRFLFLIRPDLPEPDSWIIFQWLYITIEPGHFKPNPNGPLSRDYLRAVNRVVRPT